MPVSIEPEINNELEKICRFPIKKGGKFIRKDNKIYLKFNGIRIKNIPDLFTNDSHLICVEYYFNEKCVATKHIPGVYFVDSRTHEVVGEGVSLRLINFEGLAELMIIERATQKG